MLRKINYFTLLRFASRIKFKQSGHTDAIALVHDLGGVLLPAPLANKKAMPKIVLKDKR